MTRYYGVVGGPTKEVRNLGSATHSSLNHSFLTYHENQAYQVHLF